MNDTIKAKYDAYMALCEPGSEFLNTLTEKEKAFLAELQERFLDKLLASRKYKSDCMFGLPIWFITVFEKVDTLKSEKDGRDLGFGDTGARCTWGFFYDKEKALEALENNSTDMWEYCYDYAVLEKYSPGIPGDGLVEPAQFFKYDREKDGYFMIPTPVEFKHMCNFAI